MTTDAEAQGAHALVSRAIREGEMKRGACEYCGSENTVGHHDDYTKPLQVRWLCRSHHRQWHLEHPSDVEWSATLSLRVTDDEYQFLRDTADAELRSVSGIVRLALKEFYERRMERAA